MRQKLSSPQSPAPEEPAELKQQLVEPKRVVLRVPGQRGAKMPSVLPRPKLPEGVDRASSDRVLGRDELGTDQVEEFGMSVCRPKVSVPRNEDGFAKETEGDRCGVAIRRVDRLSNTFKNNEHAEVVDSGVNRGRVVRRTENELFRTVRDGELGRVHRIEITGRGTVEDSPALITTFDLALVTGLNG